MSKITVLGSFVVDLITRTEALPRPGQTLFAHDFELGPGGKGQNQAVQAHLMGCDTEFICKIGLDDLSRVGVQFWKEIGLPTRVLQSHQYKTGCANISVDAQGQNQISVFLGANSGLTSSEVRETLANIRSSSFFLTQSEINVDALELAVDLSVQARVPVIYNPAPYRPLTSAFLNKLFLITPNETEAAALLGFPRVDLNNCKQAAHAICQLGPQHTIITLGEHGCCYATQDDVKVYPTFRVQAVDTVGAGDSFNGALAAMLAQGHEFDSAIPYALAASALSVTSKGSARSMKAFGDVESFLRTQYQSKVE
jgi:ribokinase